MTRQRLLFFSFRDVKFALLRDDRGPPWVFWIREAAARKKKKQSNFRDVNFDLFRDDRGRPWFFWTREAAGRKLSTNQTPVLNPTCTRYLLTAGSRGGRCWAQAGERSGRHAVRASRVVSRVSRQGCRTPKALGWDIPFEQARSTFRPGIMCFMNPCKKNGIQPARKGGVSYTARFSEKRCAIAERAASTPAYGAAGVRLHAPKPHRTHRCVASQLSTVYTLRRSQGRLDGISANTCFVSS